MQGAAPVQATFFDGQSAQRHAALLSVSPDSSALFIDLSASGGKVWLWPLDRLRALTGQADAGSLSLTLVADTDDESPRDPARLVVTDPAFVAWLRANAPHLRKRDVRRGTAAKILGRAAIAVAAIGLIVFVILPRMSDYLANHMPREAEVSFGRVVVAQIGNFLGAGKGGDLICHSPAGEAALNRLAARLMDGQDLQYAISFSVFDHSMVNAFAAPGGQIVILRGLLDKANSPDEVAAVLAHEIGHVEARDPTRLMLRAAGTAGIVAMLLGDATGGTIVGILGDQILQSSYTRRAESDADGFALAMLADARVSSAAFADFFDTLAGLEAGFAPPDYLSSHPPTAARATRARAHAETQAATAPVLNDADWQALKAICNR